MVAKPLLKCCPIYPSDFLNTLIFYLKYVDIHIDAFSDCME